MDQVMTIIIIINCFSVAFENYNLQDESSEHKIQQGCNLFSITSQFATQI